MIKSKLIKLLCAFSSKEVIGFRSFINSPYFNKNKKIRQLGDYILDLHPDFQQKNIDKKTVYELIYKNEKFSETRINNLTSDLFQLALNFLAQEKYARQKNEISINLMSELLRKEQYPELVRASKKFSRSLDQTPVKDANYHLNQYFLNSLQDTHFLQQSSRKADPNLQLKSNNLDLFYFASKLKIACDMTSRNIVVDAGYNCKHLHYLLEQIDDNKSIFEKVPAVYIYTKILKTLIEEDLESHFHELKQLLSENLLTFEQEELADMYDYVLNYCIKKINSGKSGFYEEVFELYKLLLENEIIFNNGILSQWDFKNILSTGLRFNNFEWVGNFLEQYKTRLPEQVRENAYSYGRAYLHFMKKEYKNALQLIHQVEFTDPSYHIGVKMIQLKSYYELNEIEPFFALVEAFKIYIFRNKQLSPYRKQANKNLLQIASKIFKLKNQKSILTQSEYNRKRKTLIALLESTEPLSGADWLNQIIEDL